MQRNDEDASQKGSLLFNWMKLDDSSGTERASAGSFSSRLLSQISLRRGMEWMCWKTGADVCVHLKAAREKEGLHAAHESPGLQDTQSPLQIKGTGQTGTAFTPCTKPLLQVDIPIIPEAVTCKRNQDWKKP